MLQRGAQPFSMTFPLSSGFGKEPQPFFACLESLFWNVGPLALTVVFLAFGSLSKSQIERVLF